MSSCACFVAALVMLAVGPQTVSAQDSDRQCYASDWDTRLSDQTSPDSASPDNMRARLTGEYLLLEIVTEGYGDTKWVSESILRILPWPTYDTTRQFGRVGRIIAYGRGRVVREGYLPDSVRKVPSPRERFFRVQYEPHDRLEIFEVTDSTHMETLVFDAGGPSLEVHEFEDGELRGRWSHTGIAVMAGKTAVGTLIERRQGYFCAWPVRRGKS